MIIKRYALWLVAMVFFALAQAQEGRGLAADYRAAEEEFVLLRNANDLLPLRRLDTLRIGFLPIGLDGSERMLEIMNRYARVDRIDLPRTASENGDWASQVAESYNLVILGIADYAPSGMRETYQEREAAIRDLAWHARTVVVVLGDGSSVGQMEGFPRAQALVYSPPNPMAHELAPQLIFGAFGARGRLEKALSGEFGLGYGLRSLGGFRLGYAPPERVGMDSGLLRDSLRSIVEEGIREGAFPGAQIVVAKNGVVVFREAFGHHTFDGRRPVRIDDLYDYASLTKITGALPALMKLYGQGLFQIDAPLSEYYPDAYGTNKANLTFRRMLSHTARLRPWIPYWQGTLRGNARYPWDDKWKPEATNEGRFRAYTIKPDSSRRFPIRLTEDLWLHRKFRERKIYRAIRESPLLDEPGYVYSGLLFYLLPRIVSDITGRDFVEYLDSEFYKRIGANTITFNPMEKFPRDRLVPTERDTFFRLEQLQGVVHDEGAALMDGVSSNAGLFSTADDLAKLMQMYMNYGHYGGEQLIPRFAVEEFTRYQYPEEGVRRGLGFDKPMLDYDPEASYVARSASPASFGHSGYTGTFAWADPEHELVFIFFSNRVYPTRDNRKLYTLNIRPRLHQACYDAMREEVTGMR